MDITDVARCVRLDIKNAIKNRDIAEGKYSVTIERFAGGCALNVNIKKFKLQILNVWRVKFHSEHPHVCISDIPTKHPAYERYTPLANKTLKKLKEIVNAYNYDKSDIMTDYFDVKFYGHIGIDYGTESNEQDILKEKSKTLNWPSAWDGYFERNYR